MFRVIRAAIRLIFLIAATVVLQTIWIAGKTMMPRHNKARRWLRKFIMTTWGRSLALILGMRIRIEGVPPRPPFFLVANHLSYVDIITIAAHLECTFVAKNDIAGWPIMGWLATGADTIFIDRKNFQDIPRVIRLINQSLDEGVGVVLFPEGTSTMGDQILPFSPALLEPAARAGYPVSYAAISYRTSPNEPPAHTAVCWWGDMDFAPHLLKLLLISKFEAVVRYGEDAIQADDRKVLAKSLWRSVNDRFIPIVKQPSSILPKKNP
ncbi:MAG: 1-acyl-sn-glycerol-3-phosphate acyltransferase [Blastocatellia bacterium]